MIASASWDRTVGLWDRAGALLARLEGHDGPVNEWPSPRVAPRSIPRAAHGPVWDVAGARNGASCPPRIRHHELLVDDEAGWLAYGATDGGTRVIDLATGAVLADLTLDAARSSHASAPVAAKSQSAR